ncbi:hypothetical protein GCM10027276_11760 [Comamonas piscis]
MHSHREYFYPKKGNATMQKARTSTLLSLAFAALSLGMLNSASANTTLHSAPTEKGYELYPAHAQPGKSRAQVQAETAEALQKRGLNALRSSNYPPMPESSASSKTRQQVVDEYSRETPAERKARLQMFRG